MYARLKYNKAQEKISSAIYQTLFPENIPERKTH